MDEVESLRHPQSECKYHLVFIPKCSRKTPSAQTRFHLGEVVRMLTAQKKRVVLGGHLMADHTINFDRNSAEIGGDTSGLLQLGQACRLSSPRVGRTPPQVRGFEILGAELLRFHPRSG